MAKIKKDTGKIKIDLSADEIFKQTVKIVYKRVSFPDPEPQVLDITTLTIREVIEQSVWRVLGEKMKLTKDYERANLFLKDNQIEIEFFTPTKSS